MDATDIIIITSVNVIGGNVMRKLTTIIVIAFVLIGMTSCDADIRGKLADMMGNLGNNVMGSDTSSVAAVTEGTKVDEENIKKPTEHADGKQTVTIGGMEIVLGSDDKVESILPEMDNREEVIAGIGNSLKNEASKNALVESMQEKPSSAVQTAASGTATVMNKAIEQIVGGAEDEGTSSLPDAVKEALSGIQESLKAISDNSSEVTQADVVTLQLVQSFVTSLNTDENKTAIENGEIPAAVLTDANNLITVASALSPASKFDALKLDLGSLLSSFTRSSDSASKALSRSEKTETKIGYEVDQKTGIVTIMVPDENRDQVFGIAKTVYSAISSITGLDSEAFASSKSALAFHKSTYENYVTFVAKKINLSFDENGDEKYTDDANYLNGNEFRSFRTYSGLMQYVVATVLSEGDNLVDVLGNDNELGEFDLGDLNLVGLVKEIAAFNSWLTDSKAEKVLRLPARYGVFFEETGEIDFKSLTDKITEIIHDNASLELALKTLQRMVVFVDLSSLPLGDVNLVSSIDGLLGWFEAELEN